MRRKTLMIILIIFFAIGCGGEFDYRVDKVTENGASDGLPVGVFNISQFGEAIYN